MPPTELPHDPHDHDAREKPFWDVGPARHLPRLEGDVEVDVCVVGLGGSGLTCVRELLRLGASVAALEAGGAGGGGGGGERGGRRPPAPPPPPLIPPRPHAARA